MRVRNAFQSPSLEAGTCVLSVELRDIHTGMSLVFQQCFSQGLAEMPAPTLSLSVPGAYLSRMGGVMVELLFP